MKGRRAYSLNAVTEREFSSYVLSFHLNNSLQLRPAYPQHPGYHRRHSVTQILQNGLRPWTFPHRYQALRCLFLCLRTRVLLGEPSLVVSQEDHEQRPLHRRPCEPNLMVLLTIALSLFHGLGGRAASGDRPPARKLHYLQTIKRKNPEITSK